MKWSALLSMLKCQVLLVLQVSKRCGVIESGKELNVKEN